MTPRPTTIVLLFLTPALLLSGVGGCAKKAERPLAIATFPESRLAKLTVTSAAFKPGRPIPALDAANGAATHSPPVQWSGSPAQTKEHVLIVEGPDTQGPDAPAEQAFVHWVAYGIPAGATSLPAGAGSSALVRQGTNSAGSTGYTGPNPPSGTPQRCVFQLFALNAPLALDDGADRDTVAKAMRGKVVATGRLTMTYQRGPIAPESK